MSHANGVVKFSDGLIMYYEYDGTVDNVVSHLYATEFGLWDHWRNHTLNKCQCEHEEDVIAYSDYGDGFYFKAKACRKCASIRIDYNDSIIEIIERNNTIDWVSELGY
jgi:hypothetical protein